MGCGNSKLFGKIKGRKRGASLTQAEREMRAAILIQRWFRRYLARLEVRRRCTWTIFQTLEYAGEQDQLKLYNFFLDLMTHMDEIAADYKNIKALTSNPTVEDDESKMLSIADPSNITIENTYKGPHLTFPLQISHVTALADAFKHKKILHVKYVLQVLLQARELLMKKPNITRASSSIAHQITVCGDLHGKLDDLLVVFQKNGLPSVENPYVFNGDFVDRGKHSMEVLLLLLVLFVLLPDDVHLNRGNHEDHVMNCRYGFTDEVLRKYKEHASKVLPLVEDLYSWLPLATIIDKKVLVVHGGISDETDLDFLATLNRHKFKSLIRPLLPPSEGGEGFQLDLFQEKGPPADWKQVLDILWSDPMPKDGCEPNVYRGGGVYFGPDVTEKLLKKHELQLLIRSHECRPEGYDYVHDRQCLTIFSASNYYDIGSNRGAYIKLIGPSLNVHITQYIAPRLHRVGFSQRVSVVEKSALDHLKKTISGSSSLLVEEFKKYDTENKGLIKVAEWCKVMEEVLGLQLPWRMLKDQLVRTQPETGLVLYKTCYENVSLSSSKQDENSPGIVETLYRHKSRLETIFRIIDKDSSGAISMAEFNEVCDLLGRQLGTSFPPGVIGDIGASLDINHDGMIDINEFLEAFRLVDAQRPTTDV